MKLYLKILAEFCSLISITLLSDGLKFKPDDYYQLSSDGFTLFTNEKTLNEYKVAGKKQIDAKGREDFYIEKMWKAKWNKDHFGPLTVPAGKYFVLGDNRDNAEDSRFIGFVDENDFVGTSLWK